MQSMLLLTSLQKDNQYNLLFLYTVDFGCSMRQHVPVENVQRHEKNT